MEMLASSDVGLRWLGGDRGLGAGDGLKLPMTSSSRIVSR